MYLSSSNTFFREPYLIISWSFLLGLVFLTSPVIFYSYFSSKLFHGYSATLCFQGLPEQVDPYPQWCHVFSAGGSSHFSKSTVKLTFLFWRSNVSLCYDSSCAISPFYQPLKSLLRSISCGLNLRANRSILVHDAIGFSGLPVPSRPWGRTGERGALLVGMAVKRGWALGSITPHPQREAGILDLLNCPVILKALQRLGSKTYPGRLGMCQMPNPSKVLIPCCPFMWFKSCICFGANTQCQERRQSNLCQSSLCKPSLHSGKQENLL